MSKLKQHKIIASVIAISLAIILAIYVPLASGEPTGITGATVVKTEVKRTKTNKRFVKKFRPWAQPSPNQIRRIVSIESRKWGASSSRLNCRINGESGHNWNARNGQYRGLGQFAPSTFARGMASIGTRKVQFVSRTYRKRIYDRKIVTYSDGKTKVTHINKRIGKRTVIRKGFIPKYPAVTHGWAQVRIMARAMVGLGAVNDSEWEVRC